MRIRQKLLLLVILMSTALLVNLLALGYLASTVITSLNTIEQVALEQQLRAVEMQARLREAEAALYRYVIEGEEGFQQQFETQLNRFRDDVDAYRAQASNATSRQWADSLADAYNQARTIGAEMIAQRNLQDEELGKLDAAQARLSDLLDEQSTSAADGSVDQRALLSAMQQDLRDLVLSVTAYLTHPAARDSVDFAMAVAALWRRADDLRALATAPSQRAAMDEIDQLNGEIAALGLGLINGHSQQQNHFALFAATLYRAGQEILANQIQPQATRDLTLVQRQLQTALAIAVASSLFVVLFASAIAGIVIGSLIRRMDAGVQTLLEGAGRVAQGDLTQVVKVEGEDELARLAEVFNSMMADLSARERHLEARLAELETLRRVGLELTGSLDPEHVLGTIATSARGLVGASEVRIFVLDGDRQHLLFAANVRRDSNGRGSVPRQPRQDGITAMAARNGEPQVVNDAANHPLFASPAVRAWGITAAAAFPLKRGDHVLGVLNVALDDRTHFSADDLRTLGLLSDQAAIALENARLYANLTEQETHLRTLVKKLAQTQEEERRLIGLDLHDGLTQLLLSANMHLGTLASWAQELGEQAVAELRLTQTRLQQAIDEARSVVAELRPAALEERGLIGGLRDYGADVARHAGWQFEFSAQIGDLKLTPAVEAAIFRIAQEAIANARKYAATSRIQIAMERSESHLVLTVRDFGQGFSVAHQARQGRHFGLEGMQERAAALGGVLEIVSNEGHGTTIIARIPLFAVEGSWITAA